MKRKGPKGTGLRVSGSVDFGKESGADVWWKIYDLEVHDAGEPADLCLMAA